MMIAENTTGAVKKYRQVIAVATTNAAANDQDMSCRLRSVSRGTAPSCQAIAAASSISTEQKYPNPT